MSATPPIHNRVADIVCTNRAKKNNPFVRRVNQVEDGDGQGSRIRESRKEKEVNAVSAQLAVCCLTRSSSPPPLSLSPFHLTLPISSHWVCKEGKVGAGSTEFSTGIKRKRKKKKPRREKGKEWSKREREKGRKNCGRGVCTQKPLPSPLPARIKFHALPTQNLNFCRGARRNHKKRLCLCVCAFFSWCCCFISLVK